MPRMIELMKHSAVPANVMRSAAKGALALPPAEMIEILVYLTSTPMFGEEARMTLASWDEATCRSVCADPNTAKEVLGYFLQNRRPRVMPALFDNPALPESALLEIAQEESEEPVEWLLASTRVNASANVLQVLSSNPVLTDLQAAHISAELDRLTPAPQADAAYGEAGGSDDVVAQFVAEHAQEIADEEGKAFELTGEGEAEPVPAEAASAAAAAPGKKRQAEAEVERMSPLQKISRLSVGDRVQLAMKGNKEERFILIRDGAKVVSAAVLESSKLTDQEVEMFASMKNVQENVLRGIAGKRKFMKVYAVVRALANNPRCPIDVQLPTVKSLLNIDLRNLSMNKNVSDTVRKVAYKLFRERTEKKG